MVRNGRRRTLPPPVARRPSLSASTNIPKPRWTVGTLIRTLLARRGRIVTALGAGWRDELRPIRETRERTDLLLSDAAALQIQICVRAARRFDGAMAEAGVLAGGSARLICEAKGETTLHLFDVFETLQAAGSDAPNLRRHFGRIHGVRAEVERLLAPYPNVALHAGVFPDTTADLETERFSFVHLDMDLEPSTRAGLEFFHPRMVPGGILLGDDYHLPDVRRVFENYFSGRPDTVIVLPWGQVVVVKQGHAHVAETGIR
jgi:O-methyltransferase